MPKCYWSKLCTKKRREMLKKCGTPCFLAPKRLGYPICRPRKCEPDKCGILAAFKRSRQYKNTRVSSRARSLLNARSSTRRSRT